MIQGVVVCAGRLLSIQSSKSMSFWTVEAKRYPSGLSSHITFGLEASRILSNLPHSEAAPLSLCS